MSARCKDCKTEEGVVYRTTTTKGITGPMLLCQSCWKNREERESKRRDESRRKMLRELPQEEAYWMEFPSCDYSTEKPQAGPPIMVRMDKIVAFRNCLSGEFGTRLLPDGGKEIYVWTSYEEIKKLFKSPAAGTTEKPPKGDAAIKKGIGLLKQLYELAWRNGDRMAQDTLEELQATIMLKLEDAERRGQVRLTRLANGYITQIEEIR